MPTTQGISLNVLQAIAVKTFLEITMLFGEKIHASHVITNDMYHCDYFKDKFILIKIMQYP